MRQKRQPVFAARGRGIGRQHPTRKRKRLCAQRSLASKVHVIGKMRIVGLNRFNVKMRRKLHQRIGVIDACSHDLRANDVGQLKIRLGFGRIAEGERVALTRPIPRQVKPRATHVEPLYSSFTGDERQCRDPRIDPVSAEEIALAPCGIGNGHALGDKLDR